MVLHPCNLVAETSDTLFNIDISDELRTTLIGEYSDEKQPSDGEVYCKIRQYQAEWNDHFQKRWRSRLSENKNTRLKQLFNHVDFSAAFDAILLPLPGLRPGMRLG